MSIPFRIMLYVFIGSEPEKGGLQRNREFNPKDFIVPLNATLWTQIRDNLHYKSYSDQFLIMQ